MAFLKDVESEELRELVKSCFKEINTLKEQLNDENKDIKSNKVVKNVLIQSESNNTNLQAKINELTDKVHKQDTYLKEKELEYVLTYKNKENVKEDYIDNQIYDCYIVKKEKID